MSRRSGDLGIGLIPLPPQPDPFPDQFQLLIPSARRTSHRFPHPPAPVGGLIDEQTGSEGGGHGMGQTIVYTGTGLSEYSGTEPRERWVAPWATLECGGKPPHSKMVQDRLGTPSSGRTNSALWTLD